MINLLVTKFTKKLVKKKIINFKQYELCLLGFEMILTTTLQLGALLAFGMMIGHFLETVVFLICFSSLRAYAGGYHAPNVWICTFIMGLMMCIDFAVIDYLGIYKNYVTILFLNTVSFGLLLNYSIFPKVNVFQKTKHIKISKCLIVFMGLFLVIVVLSQWGEFWSRLAAIGSIALLFEALTLIKLKNGGILDENDYKKSVSE